MNSPNNEGDIVPPGQILSLNEASSSWIRLHSIEFLAKGIPWKTQTTQGCCQDSRSSPQTNSKASLLKTIPTQLIELETPSCYLYRTFTLVI